MLSSISSTPATSATKFASESFSLLMAMLRGESGWGASGETRASTCSAHTRAKHGHVPTTRVMHSKHQRISCNVCVRQAAHTVIPFGADSTDGLWHAVLYQVARVYACGLRPAATQGLERTRFLLQAERADPVPQAVDVEQLLRVTADKHERVNARGGRAAGIGKLGRRDNVAVVGPCMAAGRQSAPGRQHAAQRGRCGDRFRDQYRCRGTFV